MIGQAEVAVAHDLSVLVRESELLGEPEAVAGEHRSGVHGELADEQPVRVGDTNVP